MERSFVIVGAAKPLQPAASPPRVRLYLHKLDSSHPISSQRIDSIPITRHTASNSALLHSFPMLLGCQFYSHEPILNDLLQLPSIQVFDAQNVITNDVDWYSVVKLAAAWLNRLAPRNQSRSDTANRGAKNAGCCAPRHAATPEALDLPQDRIENFGFKWRQVHSAITPEFWPDHRIFAT